LNKSVVGLYNALRLIEDAEFIIGSREGHPLVHEVHKRLPAIDYLNFTDPADDLYTEATRRAVTAFREAGGLMHDGGGERCQAVTASERGLHELGALGYVSRDVLVG
jgi:hypothetical protein